MLLLIAESKTMAGCDGPVAENEFVENRPVFEHVAEAIMGDVAGMSFEELCVKTRLSVSMVRRLISMAAAFQDQSRGCRAIEAYTGVVFRAFDYKSLSGAERERASRDIRIISSLYGCLRPEDIVRVYRLDFGMRLAPDGEKLSSYLREMVTEAVLAYLRANDCSEIIDLLPGDASACIDRKRVEDKAKVWKVDFKITGSGGREQTPNAGQLKKLRGELLRQIIREEICTPQEVMEMTGNDPMSINDSERRIVIRL